MLSGILKRLVKHYLNTHNCVKCDICSGTCACASFRWSCAPNFLQAQSKHCLKEDRKLKYCHRISVCYVTHAAMPRLVRRGKYEGCCILNRQLHKHCWWSTISPKKISFKCLLRISVALRKVSRRTGVCWLKIFCAVAEFHFSVSLFSKFKQQLREFSVLG